MNTIMTIESAFAQLPSSSPSKSEGEFLNGRWTKEEHQRFVEAIKLHGKNWKKVEESVGSRSGAQIRSHAQKFFLKIEKEHKASQKSKGNKDNGKSNKRITESLTSALESLSALVKTEDNLKANLSFNELHENFTEASENSTVLPVSPDTHLVAAEKSIEYLSNAAAAKPNDMQSECSAKTDDSKLSKKQLLSKIKACEDKVEEYHHAVGNFAAHHTTDTTSTSNQLNTAIPCKPYHHYVYLDLMNYLNVFNKQAKSLKISDLVDLSYSMNTTSEESYCDAPAGKKKVKIL